MTQAFNLSQLANNVNTTGQLNAAAGLYNQTPVANGGTGLSTATGALVGAGSTISAIAAGTAGNVLTSNGTTWTSAVSAGGPAPVVRIYTSPSPWTKSPTLKAVKITLCSGGGGGACMQSIPSGSVNNMYFSGGGGASGIGFFNSPSIPGPVTVTVGAGGAGGTTTPAAAGNPSAAGGASSFGALISATGGGGQISNPRTAPTAIGAGGSITPSPAIIGINGGPGRSTITLGIGLPSSSPSAFSLYMNAGPTGFGLGTSGFSVPSGSPTAILGPAIGSPIPPNGYGGGGGSTEPSQPAPGQTGGNGIVIVEEFY